MKTKLNEESLGLDYIIKDAEALIKDIKKSNNKCNSIH